eukprot:9636549-Prorocentrum_lima.AAC.1
MESVAVHIELLIKERTPRYPLDWTIELATALPAWTNVGKGGGGNGGKGGSRGSASGGERPNWRTRALNS